MSTVISSIVDVVGLQQQPSYKLIEYDDCTDGFFIVYTDFASWKPLGK